MNRKVWLVLILVLLASILVVPLALADGNTGMLPVDDEEGTCPKGYFHVGPGEHPEIFVVDENGNPLDENGNKKLCICAGKELK